MSLETSLSAMRTTIINAGLGFTSNNCSIGDEAVFNYIQTTAGQTRCCIVDYEGFNDGGMSEFASVMTRWRIAVNAFFILGQNYVPVLTASRAFVDGLIQTVATNSTLGGAVLGAKAFAGSAPLVYDRSNYSYILIPMEVIVFDNIS